MLNSRVNVMTFVKEVINNLKPEMDGRMIEWDIGKLPDVQSDRNILSLVWTNLISNALKFSCNKLHTKIEISANSDMKNSKEIVFSIKDNGVGFDMEYQEKLFVIFHDCIASKILRGQEWVWLMFSELLPGMVAGYGRKACPMRGRYFILLYQNMRRNSHDRIKTDFTG